MVLILAAVLALNGADLATISAITSDLERVFHIGKTSFGVLASVVALTGAVFTLQTPRRQWRGSSRLRGAGHRARILLKTMKAG